eukprot:scpid35960/ scgid25681/ Coatomer subunit gamma-2; Gamma-2-coat protein
MLKKKEEDEGVVVNPFANLEKSAVLQEARIFNETAPDTKKCRHVLTKIMFMINQGETIGTKEATETFFSMTKLFQSQKPVIRRLLYLAIKEMANVSEDVIIVTSSLTKDMTGKEDLYRGGAIRALCRITDSTMIQSIERYMKQAIVDRNPTVASAALVSSVHMLLKGNEVVKRWVNEVQEAVSSENRMVQYHALGLLYHIRSADRMAVSKLVAKHTKSSLRSPHATCLLIRIAAKALEESEPGSAPSDLINFLESCVRNKSEMVMYEAARCLGQLTDAKARSITTTAVSTLSIMLNSPKPTLRFAALRALNKMAMQDPSLIQIVNHDLELLITDSNRSIATLAITTLLKTGQENKIDLLMKQISTYMGDIAEEFKVVIVDAIRNLCSRFPKKYPAMLSFLGTALREEGGVEFKTAIVEAIINILEENPEAKDTCLGHLCEYIEDCEHVNLAVRVLHLVGVEGSRSSRPNTYIRYVYNRVMLENAQIRAAAITALAKFGAADAELLPSILTLLERGLYDTDDEVRDRATFYYHLLKDQQKSHINTYVLNRLPVSIVGLESALFTYMNDTSQHDVPFDIKTVPLETSADSSRLGTATSGASTAASLTAGSASASGAAAAAKTGASAQDVYSEQLAAIPEFADLGPLFRSSIKPVELTESETEYVVRCVRHMFANHVVFQFDCTNTLNDQLLENVSVALETGDEGFELVNTVPIARLPYNQPSTTYTCMALDEDPSLCASGSFSCTLKFIVKDCDPVTQEPDGGDGYEDEYVLEDLEVTLADHMSPLATSSFSTTWEELGEDNEDEDTYALTSMKSLEAAVDQVMQFMGMHACERTGKVQEGKSTHVLLLAGMFRNHEKVLVRARLALTDSVTMKIAVRSADDVLRQVVVSSVG